MSQSKLNKELFNEVTKLKLCHAPNSPVRFVIKRNPFTENGDDEDSQATASAQNSEHVITGLIYPKSEIYNQRAYEIELKLTDTFPIDPPDVRFLTKIYHPNVGEDGMFCNALLKKTARWTQKTSLVDVVRVVCDHIDHPDIDYSLRPNVGRQYLEKPDEFKQIALDYVEKFGLPRN